MLEVIDGKLAWGPAGGSAKFWPEAKLFSFDSISSPDFRSGRYEVYHYQQEALGAAFGPLALDQTLRASYELSVLLKGEQAVAFEHGGSPKEHANAAVILGSVLILKEAWTAQAVAEKLPREARLRFACSWMQPSKPLQPTMTVQDCWEGIELAKRLGWLSPLDDGVDDLVVLFANSKFWRSIVEYDGTWLAPGKVFVMADPVTVLCDPNPLTFSELVPSLGEPLDGCVPVTPSSLGSRTPAQAKSPLMQQPAEEPVPLAPPADAACNLLEARRDEGGSEMTSVHSVCKQYVLNQTVATGWPKPLDLVTFCKRHEILGVVRTNCSEEGGLRELGGSYKAEELRTFGLQHFNVFVKDTHGGVPSRAAVMQFLRSLRGLGIGQTPEEMRQSAGAVLIHCKSGFGRSVVLACCLVIYLHDADGRGLLGWSRLVRPGAITTREQEEFLRGLRGRASLLRYAGMPLDGAQQPVAQKCCAVQ